RRDAIELASVAHLAVGDVAQTEIGVLPAYVRLHRHLGRELLATERRMQDVDMERIRAVFPILQPVPRHDLYAVVAADAETRVRCENLLVGREALQCVPARQHRLLLRQAHIGEDEPVELLHRIPGLSDAVLSYSAIRLAGLVEAAS